ncbi:MAG TPA: hypothetical protein VIV40_22610 [Kofleriaceae bacterium]
MNPSSSSPKRLGLPFAIRAAKLPTLVGMPTTTDTEDEAPLYLSAADVREIELLLVPDHRRKVTLSSLPMDM